MGNKVLRQKFLSCVNYCLPVNSRRRMVASFIYRTIKRPRKIIQHFSFRRVYKLLHYLLTEDSQSFRKRLDIFFNIHEPLVKFNLYKPQDEILVFKKEDAPTVSIIIPAYNQWAYTFSCLGSILENSKDVSFEVIVADDVSSDETLRISEYVKNIVVVRNTQNKGFLLNCNNAATYARGKYILFLNNDTNVQENWLKYLVDLIESDKTIGMVGSKLIYPDSRLQEAGGIIWKDASGCNYGRLDDPEKPEYNYVKQVDYISGASIMIRADLWKKIGGFDERYSPAYFEDADLAFEVRKQGYKVVYQPQSVVVHFEGISHGTDVNSGIKSYQLINRDKFVEKWQDVLQLENFANGENVFWARDRSSAQKTILVIENIVPNYDKDAGSRTTFQYLKLFKKMGLNIKFVADNFYPYQPYTNELLQLGIEVLYGDWYSDNFEGWLKEQGQYIDYTYLLRPDVAKKYIDLIKKHTNSKVIYNGADFHWIREERKYSIDKNPETLRRAKEYKEIEFQLFNKSDVVITISEYEKALLQQEMPDKKIQVIPTFIYEGDFPLGKTSDDDKRRFITFVGGFLHTPNVDGIIWFVQKIWPQIQSAFPDLELKVIGSNPPPEVLKLSDKKIEVTGYLSDEALAEYYSKTRIVIAPLRYGAGVKGKIIEAIAHGIPVVTTSVGAEGIKDAEQLLAVQDSEEMFAQSVVRLMNDKDIWKKTKQACIDYSEKHFSMKCAEEILTNHIFK